MAKLKPGARTLKTHLPLSYWKEHLDNNPEIKVIQVIRDPKDMLVSYYKFYGMNKQLGCYFGSWDEFFEMFKAKELASGDFFDWSAEWFSYLKGRENTLIVYYKDMKKDLRGHIKQLSDFLGKNLSDKVIDIITERTTFANMAKDPLLMPKDIPFFKKDAKFMRKGAVGGWKEVFTPEQIEFVDQKCKDVLEPIGLKFGH